MACPFAKLSIGGAAGKCPVSKPAGKPTEEVIETGREQADVEQSEGRKEGSIGASVGGKCPFGYDKPVREDIKEREAIVEPEERRVENGEVNTPGQCPFGYDKKPVKNGRDMVGNEQEHRKDESADVTTPGKCPLGYDSVSFKIGPLSCVLCRALLYNSSRCVPCRHIFCRACISPFQDCPLCGLDIESIASDPDMQGLVDRFIEGHARIKRPSIQVAGEENEKEEGLSKDAIKYEDISVERGSFLVQQAMRAFQAKNLESAKARLGLCVEDSREEMSRSGATSTSCSQLGALLGMLGDCCRAMEDIDGAIANYEESVEFLSQLPGKDSELVHALSVSLNKLGDLKYYAEDLEAARAFYARALKVRLDAITDFTTLSSQVLDVAISLAKVADVDLALGNERAASEGFQEALKKLEKLSLPGNAEDSMLGKKRLSVMTFLHSQLTTTK